MTHNELLELLLKANFTNGWTLSEETLTQWEHDVDPPAPLKRPEATDDLAG
jgi:hypothetical protein